MVKECMVALVVPATPEEAFNLLTDFTKFQDIDESNVRMEFLSDQQRGLGTKTRWRIERWDFPEERDEEVVAWQEGKSYTFRTLTPPIKDGTLTFEPHPEGTLITFRNVFKEDMDDPQRWLAGMVRELVHTLRYFEEKRKTETQ